MAKKHSWHFYTLIITITFLLLGYLLWSFTPIKDEVEAVVIRKLQPYLGESFLINDFSIRPTSISFYKVRAADANSTFLLDLEEIRIDFDPLKLFSHNFNIPGIIESVTIVRPSLGFYYDQDRLPVKRDLPLEKVFEEIITNIQKFPEIEYITISDGQLYLQVQGGKQFPLMNHMEGRLSYQPNVKEVALDLSGNYLNAPDASITLHGDVDFERRRWQADLFLDECVLTSDWPFWKLGYFQLENARVKGAIHIESPSFSVDSINFSGQVEVADFAAHIYNQKAVADSFVLRMSRQDVLIDTFACKIEDGTGRFWGRINTIFSPVADWSLEVEDYSIKHLYQAHKVFEFVYEGKAEGILTINGPFNDLTLTAQMSCPEMLYAVIPFNTVRVQLQYTTKNKLMTFNYIRADFFEFRTRGTGQIDFNTLDVDLLLNSDIYVPYSYFTLLNGLNSGKILINTVFKGNFKTKVFDGNFKYWVYGGDEQVFIKGRGPFTLLDQLFNFTLHSDDFSDTFEAHGTIEDLFSDPRFVIMEVLGFPAQQFTKNPLIISFLEGRDVNLYFSGPYDFLSAKMNITPRGEHRNIITLNSSIKDIFMDYQRFKGNFSAHTAPAALTGKYEVIFSETGYQTIIDAPGLFSADLFVGATPDSPFSGTVHISQFSFADYFQNSPAVKKIIEEGVVSGDLQVGGTIENPNIQFELDARDFIVNKVGYYTTMLSGRLSDYQLTVDNFWVRLNSDSVLNADLSYHVLEDSLYLAVRGENIESNFLAETIFGDPEIINGSFSYTFNAVGPFEYPTVYGDVQISNGTFVKNPFRSVIFTFQDSVTIGGDFWNLDDHIVQIQKFLYINRDDYTVEGHGLASLDQYGLLDLYVSVQGNVLAELPRIMPYFRNPRTEGFLNVHLTGSRAVPQITSMELQITNGAMQFADVIPPISDLKIDIVLREEDNFVEIKTLEAKVGGRWARISNRREVVLEDSTLEHWVFEDLNLDFGVLVLETEEKGIPLSFYGLMEEGDIGYFAAGGKKKGEEFYFAGPVQLPIARGSITLYDCRITFPFIGMEYIDGEWVYQYEKEEEETPVIDFLRNMRWDVIAYSGQNNRYFVDVPGYVGEAHLDLNIDNNSPGLEFNGRLIDDSFTIEGEMVSSRGDVEYLDVKFRVEEFGAEFNRFEIFPEVYGKAYTTVRDSTGSFPIDIYLVLYVIDPVTKKEVNKGRWEDFRFKLESRNPASDKILRETQETLLAYLGYSFDNLQYKAGEVGLTMTENFLIRPLFRPLERQLERELHLDYVRFRSSFTSNLFYLSFQGRADIFNRPTFTIVNNNLDPALLLIQSSGVTLGKYLLKDFYMTYTGQLVAGYEESKLGVNHTLGLEYRVLYNLLLEVEYSKFQFNPFYSENITNDLRIRLRHSFSF